MITLVDGICCDKKKNSFLFLRVHCSERQMVGERKLERKRKAVTGLAKLTPSLTIIMHFFWFVAYRPRYIKLTLFEYGELPDQE